MRKHKEEPHNGSKLLICESMAQVEELIHACKTTGHASVDFETPSLKYLSQPDAMMLGVSFQPGSSWIIPMEHKESPWKGGKWKKPFKIFCKEVIEDWDIIKTAWNLKFEYKWFMRYGHLMKGRLFDAMLAKYCLDEERPHDLKDFVKNFYPRFANYEQEIGRLPWPDKPFDKLTKYCGIDCDLTGRGMIYLEKRLINQGFYNLFRNLLMMHTRVLAESEYTGVPVDRPYLENLVGKYKTKLSVSEGKLRSTPSLVKYERNYKREHTQKLIKKVTTEIEIIREADEPNAARLIANREAKIKAYLEGKFSKKETFDGVNFGSPDQLANFLFNSKHGLRLKVHKKTEKGKPSTDEETLKELQKKDKSHFMENLLDHRGLSKLDSTYISGMLQHLDEFNRIHAGYKIHGTVTGRLSCTEPNMQNIPRDTTASDIKKMFVPPPGYLLLEVDYSQAELRVVAELSKDKAMIDIFKRNYNIHVATACKLNGGIHLYDKVKGILKKADMMSGEELKKPENKEFLFWAKKKKQAKTVNFGILYGEGPDKLAVELDCSVDEAKEIIKGWLSEYPGVRKWIQKQKEHAYEHGYVMNLFGRKRRLYNIEHESKWMRLEAERQAVNTPIQGTSSDFTSLAQVIIREQIKIGKLPHDMTQAYTVHDSIGYWVKISDVHKVVPIVIKICDNPDTQALFNFQLKHVTMKVSAEISLTSWGELESHDPWADYLKRVA